MNRRAESVAPDCQTIKQRILRIFEKYDYLEDCFSFEIVDGGALTSRVLPKSAGLLFLTPTWKKSKI